MKKYLFAVFAASIVGCGQNNDNRGPMLNEPAGRNRAGVVTPGEYPGGTNVQGHDNSNVDSTNRQALHPPIGTGRANSGSYETTNRTSNP